MEKEHYEELKDECLLGEIDWLTGECTNKREKLERELERMDWGNDIV